MQPITEIIIFDATEAYRENPAIITGAFDIALKQDGVHSPARYGLQIENASTGCLFLDWDNLEAHKAFMSAEVYPTVIENLKPGMVEGGSIVMMHIKFSGPASILLDKPTPEVCVLTLKAPENRTDMVDTLSKLSEAMGNVLVYGQTLEDENRYVVLGGWESVQAHEEVCAKPEVVAVLAKLSELAKKEQHSHATLLKYPL